MTKAITLLSMTLLSFGCSLGPVTNEPSGNPAVVSAPNSVQTPDQLVDDNNENRKRFSESIEGVRGLVVLGDNYEKPDDLIRFYNEDGSVWYEFTFYDDDSDGDFEYRNADFLPYSFHPDYFNLALKLISERGDRYEVVVNEETGLRKFVKKGDKNLRFESWPDHILKTFAIEFDKDSNPLRISPEGVVKPGEVSKIERFHPDSIKGEWLKLKWDKGPNPNDDPKLMEFGWIKWKDQNRLLIEWFYFA